VGAAAIAAALTRLLGRAAGRHGPTTTRVASGRDVVGLLEGLPVRKDHLARPGEVLVQGLERLRELTRRREELSHALGAARERVARSDSAVRELALELGRDGSADAEGIARDLDRDLREAERLRDAALVAERELAAIDVERKAVTVQLDGTRAELDALSARAARLATGDAERGLEQARARMAAHARADQVQEEVERTHPDLEQMRAQIEELDRTGHSWSVDDEAMARCRARIEAHDDASERLATRAEALEQEAAHLRDLETVDAVDGEIASLRDEESRLTRARDRKRVLAHLLREADRRFREEHQPDLVRRAGSYLRHLTGGRYDRLVIDETHDDHLFHVVGPSLPAPVPLAPPVSTGTLEQAYLSLRLAIVDHLDQGGERLPLFIDEVFVNWDGERRTRGLEVLAGVSSTRQVFVFTCHPGVAAELERHGGRVLQLGTT
jgi:uncharacterized protein YhaN